MYEDVMKRTVVEAIDLKKTHMLGKIPMEALLGARERLRIMVV